VQRAHIQPKDLPTHRILLANIQTAGTPLTPWEGDSDAMDISPLPHKPPFNAQITTIPLQSPTPEATPVDEVVSPGNHFVSQPNIIREIPGQCMPDLKMVRFSSTGDVFGKDVGKENYPWPRTYNPPKKPAGPPSRRPAKFRRSLSMFESPADILNEDQKHCTVNNLQQIADIEETPRLKLPHFIPEDQPDSLPRITSETMLQLFAGAYNHLFDHKMIIDCRFEYEYEGGHINQAVNFCDKEALAEELFIKNCTSNTLLIFHCEYSAHRAPLTSVYYTRLTLSFSNTSIGRSLYETATEALMRTDIRTLHTLICTFWTEGTALFLPHINNIATHKTIYQWITRVSKRPVSKV
jgi:hypothetical protein